MGALFGYLLRAMKVLVLVNPRAGLHRDRAVHSRKVRDLFPPGDVEVETPESAEEMGERARAAARAGTPMVVAAGGDGTINDVARQLIGSETILGILPLGSGNGFSRGLGIGATVARAIKILHEGVDRSIDVGEVNGAPFFCVSGIGFDAVVGEEFQRSPVRGVLPYFGIAARESLQYRPVEVTLRFEDHELVTRAFLVAVANMNQFGGGAKIAPNADPRDGLLDVVVIRKLNVFEMLFYTPKLFDGSIDKVTPLETYRSREFRILRSQRGPMHLDGNPVEEGHVLDYRVRPGALRVRVPAGNAGD
ncbi:MAG: diacylglycerol kinase family protein [Candidatus Eisenbacteria bacterium]